MTALDLVLLNPYGVHVRYPNELAVDDTIAKLAIENAQKLFNFCHNLINSMIEKPMPSTEGIGGRC